MGSINSETGAASDLLPPSRRRRLLWCWALLTAVLAVRLAVRCLGPGPQVPFATPVKIDINTAAIPELMSLPGMGRTRAAAVVLHRVRFGRFATFGELARVDGIGPSTVEALRPFLAPLPSWPTPGQAK